MSDQPNQPKMAEDKVIKVGKYNIKVLRDTCIGAASCLAVAPLTFELDSQNKSTVKADSQDLPETILMAVQSCPTKAIVVTDAETGEQIWPA